jgi:RecB family exonuclease
MASAWLADADAAVAATAARTYSISEIETYLRCPARWHYRYVEHLPDPPGPAAEWGLAFHQAVEAFYQRQPLPELAPDLAAAWTAYRDAIAQHVRPLPDWVERWVTFTLADAPFVGRIDCVDDQLTVRDTKTRARRPTQDELNDSLQLTAYWAAVAQTLGTPPRAVAWDLLIRLKTPVAETWIADRTPRDVARLERIVARVLTAQAQGHIWPHWGSLGCSTCPYRDRCLTDWQ